MDCQFVQAGIGLVKCSVCGRSRKTTADPARLRMRCRAAGNTAPAIAKPTAAPKPRASRPEPEIDWWPKDADGFQIPTNDMTPEDLPCPHRGEVLRENVLCDLCGLQGVLYSVYECAKHGECSLVPRKKGGKLRDCFKCSIRHEALRMPPITPFGTLPVVSAPAEVVRTAAAAGGTGPIRVAILTPDLGAGGAERWIASLAKFLPGDRAKLLAVGVVNHGQKWDPICREITTAGTPIYGTREVRWGLHPTAESTVTYLATDEDVAQRTLAGADVVVSWGLADPSNLLNSANCRGPHVVVSHGASDWARNQLRRAANTATHCVAVSAAAATAFPDGLLVKVIWNGSELERLTPTRPAAEVRESWGCTADELLVGFVGRLSPEKNPLAVAHLVHELRRRMPDREIRPVWIGTGLEDAVAKIKRDAGALSGCRGVWVPPPAHIGDAWQALDLHVMASPEEGFSLVVTEGLIAGVPTVATRTGIVPDLLAQWGNLVVPVDVGADGEQLADAAEIALSDEHAANVRRARQVVWEEFTAAKMGSRWAEFLAEVVG